MAFSNQWDTTFPPDTQLANLLGQDIRNGVKVDVQQRMAAISGLDAAKPNFAGDVQPANWNGILFFATDTGKIYQFNNPAWTNVTNAFSVGNLIKRYSIYQPGQTNGNGQIVATLTVPSAIMQVKSLVELCYSAFSTSGGCSTALYLDGTYTYAFPNTATEQQFRLFALTTTAIGFSYVAGNYQTFTNVLDISANPLVITLVQSGGGTIVANGPTSFFDAVVFP
jgi:hypothetical protein